MAQSVVVVAVLVAGASIAGCAGPGDDAALRVWDAKPLPACALAERWRSAGAAGPGAGSASFGIDVPDGRWAVRLQVNVTGRSGLLPGMRYGMADAAGVPVLPEAPLPDGTAPGDLFRAAVFHFQDGVPGALGAGVVTGPALAPGAYRLVLSWGDGGRFDLAVDGSIWRSPDAAREAPTEWSHVLVLVPAEGAGQSVTFLDVWTRTRDGWAASGDAEECESDPVPVTLGIRSARANATVEGALTTYGGPSVPETARIWRAAVDAPDEGVRLEMLIYTDPNGDRAVAQELLYVGRPYSGSSSPIPRAGWASGRSWSKTLTSMVHVPDAACTR